MAKKLTPDMRTVGSTGLPVWAGRVYDEVLLELQGERGRRILREMSEQDPIVGGTLLGIELLARQVPWIVKPANNSDKAKEIAEFFDGALTDMTPSWSNTITEILSMLPYGWSWLEIVYKKRKGLNPDDQIRSSRFDDGKVGWGSWSIRGQETLLRWEYEGSSTDNHQDTGQLTGMWQQAPPSYRTVLIPRKKSLHFTTRSRRENPEGISILRNAYRSWYMKKNIEVIEGIGVERDLAGLPVLHAPANLFSNSASDEEKELFEMLKKMVTSIKHDENEGVLLPAQYDENNNELYKLELLSTGGDRQFDTNGIIGRYNQNIAMSMLADFILLGHEAQGSFALSSTKTNLFSTAISAFLDIMADEINFRAFPQLALMNGYPLDLIPTLMHGKIETADLGKLGEFLKQLAAAGMTVFPNPSLESYVLDVAGLPGRDPGAGDLPAVDANGNPVDELGNPILDPVTGLPVASVPLTQVIPNGGGPGNRPTPAPQPAKGTAEQPTPISAARKNGKIVASEESKSKHFVPLSTRVAKLHAKLSGSLEPIAYAEFLTAVMDAGAYTKLSQEYQELIAQAELLD